MTVDYFISWLTELGAPLRKSISLITRQATKSLQQQLQLQLQQIATINIFDVISVVAAAAAAASDYLMHLHIWPQNSEKAESWHVAIASPSAGSPASFRRPSLVLISAHEWPASKAPASASYLYSIGQFIADASIACPNRSRKPTTLLGVGGPGTDCVSLTWCSGPNRWPTNWGGHPQ